MTEGADTHDPQATAMKPDTKHLRWWLATFLTALFVLAFLEGAARLLTSRSKDPNLRQVLWGYNRLAHEGASEFRFVPDPELSYRLKPNFVLRSDDKTRATRHNALGFRDDFDDSPKPEGTLRIACLGASTTYSVGVEDNSETYPSCLEKILQAEPLPEGWNAVEVLNLGVGGYTSLEVLGTLKRCGPMLKADVVLVQSAINDVAPRFYPDFSCDYKHFRKPLQAVDPGPLARLFYRSRLFVTLGWALGALEPLTLQARTQYPMPPTEEALENFERNGPECYQKNLEEMISLCEESGVVLFLLTQAYLNLPVAGRDDPDSLRIDAAYRQGLKQHNVILRKLTLTTSAHLVDLDLRMPLQKELFKDSIHMTAEGNRVKAKIVAESIFEYLPKRGM